ncbi:hypothetical protein FALCPG4_015456 [Fusarium falciforme]
MARTRTKNVDTSLNTRATPRLRTVQSSYTCRVKRNAQGALIRRQRSKPRSPSLLHFPSSPKRFYVEKEGILPTEDSPLQGFSYLDVPRSAISQTIRPIAPYAIMGDETVDSSGPGLHGADLTLRDHDDPPDLERQTKPTSLDKMGGGKDREDLEGKKHRKSAGRKNISNSEEPTDADNTAELAEPKEKRDDTEEPRYEVEAIVGYSIKNDTEVELKVKWAGNSEPTLVDECTFQEDCPLMLYNYWQDLGSREKATGIKNLFHVFSICDWRIKEKLEFEVHWVGYPPEQSTWELAWRVKDFAEEMHAKYLETRPAARKAWEKENQRSVGESAM